MEEVEAEQIKAKLYLDKQESIPRSALSFCQKLVSDLRKLRCSKDEDCIAKFMGIRKLRNVLVEFADKFNSKTRSRSYSLHPKSSDKISIMVDAKSLYLLFAETHDIHKTSSQFFTSYLKRLLKEQKLHPSYTFVFSNKYNLRFSGVRYVDVDKNKAKASTVAQGMKGYSVFGYKSYDDAPPKSSAELKEVIKILNAKIKESRLQQKELNRLLIPLEKDRMDQARIFSREEKKRKEWNEINYKSSKEARKKCDDIYIQLQQLRSFVSGGQSEMYQLNKALHRQPFSGKPNAAHNFQSKRSSP
ncbi:unnamed protein product [Mucor hiemalis]